MEVTALRAAHKSTNSTSSLLYMSEHSGSHQCQPEELLQVINVLLFTATKPTASENHSRAISSPQLAFKQSLEKWWGFHLLGPEEHKLPLQLKAQAILNKNRKTTEKTTPQSEVKDHDNDGQGL